MFQLSKNFLFAGGYDRDIPGYLDTVYEYDNVDVGWVLREQSLDACKYYMHVIFTLYLLIL